MRAAGGESPDQDFQQVQGAVLRECVVNLARIKEYVAQNVSGTLDAAGFDNWPELMRGINAGLLMLGKIARGRDHRGDHAAPETRDAARRHQPGT